MSGDGLRGGAGKSGRAIPAVPAVFLLSLAIRVIYIMELSGSPASRFPLIDSATYWDIAGGIFRGGGVDPRLFWQGFLYPLLLGVVHILGNGSMTAARLVQAVIGSATCVMVLLAGRRLFDDRAALTAAVVTALYGPLVFFETDFLATGMAAFWMITLLLVFDRVIASGRVRDLLAAGLVSAAAVLTRATFLPPVLLMMAWSVWRPGKKSIKGRNRLREAGIMAATLAAVLLAVSVISFRTTGYFGFLPRSGSLNLYLGNNPDTDRTLMIRPGAGWRELTREPEMNGYTGDEGHREYFMRRFREYAASDTPGFLAGLGAKAVQLMSSRELPRNLDIYTWRGDSRLLGALVWKAGRFGFPFGLLFPLAVIGAVFAHGRRPGLAAVMLISYAAALILVFISSRYRAPMVPVLALLGASGFFEAARIVRKGAGRERVTLAAVAVVAVLVSVVPGPFTIERFDYKAEKHACLGYEMGKAGRLDEAEEQLKKAVLLEPDSAPARRMLGSILNQAGRPGEAVPQFEEALRLEPGSYTTHFYMAVALYRTGDAEGAQSHLDEAGKGAVKAKDAAFLRQIDGMTRAMKREGDETEDPNS